MMGTTVFIIDSPLHFIFTIAIIKKLNISNYSIHWFNKTSLQVYFPENIYIDKYNIIDFSNLDFESFSGFINNYNQYITEVKNNIDSIDYLFTCSDTHFGFEILRNIFSIPWNNVGIIEDGIDNYFPHRMPSLMKQIPKSIINKIRMSYFLNVSRYNLGGNPKIGFLSTLSPEHVFLHKDSKAKILNIKNEVKTVLQQYPKKSKNVYIEAEVILFLPAVLYYNRMSEKEVISYLRYVKTHPKISNYSNIVIKPHPREKIKLLKEIILKEFFNEFQIAGISAIELHLSDIKADIWAGSPSTGMLNKYLLSKDKNTEYILFPTKKKSGLNEQIAVLEKVFCKNLDIYYQY